MTEMLFRGKMYKIPGRNRRCFKEKEKRKRYLERYQKKKDIYIYPYNEDRGLVIFRIYINGYQRGQRFLKFAKRHNTQ